MECKGAGIGEADAAAVLVDHVDHGGGVAAVGAGALGDGLANLDLKERFRTQRRSGGTNFQLRLKSSSRGGGGGIRWLMSRVIPRKLWFPV